MSSFHQLISLAEQDLENSRLLLDNRRYRASISRAYYAMYYGTQALLDFKKISSRTHKGMVQQFGQYFDTSAGDFPAEVSKKLSDLTIYASSAIMKRLS